MENTNNSAGAQPDHTRSGQVTVTVTASDAGIAGYGVNVADNGGVFTRALFDTPQTSMPYEGERGHTYTFRVTAVDRANNAGSAEAVSQGETIRKYYALGGKRVAMRDAERGDILCRWQSISPRRPSFALLRTSSGQHDAGDV